jgi:hypothetical protein
LFAGDNGRGATIDAVEFWPPEIGAVESVGCDGLGDAQPKAAAVAARTQQTRLRFIGPSLVQEADDQVNFFKINRLFYA